MNADTVADLLVGAAPLLDAERLTAWPDTGWGLSLGDDVLIDIDIDVVVPRLVLTADAGQMPAHDRLRACELLLSCNYLWTTHGGVRGALDPARNEVALLLDVPAQELDLQSLVSILGNFKAVVLAWREALAGMSAAQTTDHLPAMPGLMGHGMIRA
jgi:hypothetical protein